MDERGLAGRSLDELLRRDRAFVLAGLVAATLLAWAYTVHLAGSMGSGVGSAMAMPRAATWGVAEAGAVFLMWAVMMVAMMLPSAAPMILLYASIARRRRERSGPVASTALFVTGYIVVWGGYSLAATLAQGWLQRAALVSPGMGVAVPWLAGALLIAAGVYQWTPWKQACLRHCQSPLGFITSQWREGRRGALVMGLRHGAYCLGCCWILMALLFVAGVMNVLWVIAIAALVLVEKVTAIGRRISLLAGPAFVLWGAWLIARSAGGP